MQRGRTGNPGNSLGRALLGVSEHAAWMYWKAEQEGNSGNSLGRIPLGGNKNAAWMDWKPFSHSLG